MIFFNPVCMYVCFDNSTRCHHCKSGTKKLYLPSNMMWMSYLEKIEPAAYLAARQKQIMLRNLWLRTIFSLSTMETGSTMHLPRVDVCSLRERSSLQISAEDDEAS